MKKFLVSVLLSGVVLCGCSQSEELNTMQDSIEIEAVTPQAIQSYTTAEPKSDDKIKFTKGMDKSIKDFYSKYTYGVVTQDILTGVDINKPQRQASYVITVDTKSKYTKLIYKEDNKVVIETLHDYKKNKTYVREDKKWVKKPGKYTILDWNLQDFDNLYDVYKCLLGNNKVKVNADGTTDGDTYTFCKEVKKPNKKALSGVDFDTLDSQTNLFVIKKDKDTFIPVTNMVDFMYTKGDYKYFCRTSFTFSDMSKKKSLSK